MLQVEPSTKIRGSVSPRQNSSLTTSLFCHQESIEPAPAHFFPYDKSAERKKREKEEKEGREKGEERIVEELCVA